VKEERDFYLIGGTMQSGSTLLYNIVYTIASIEDPAVMGTTTGHVSPEFIALPLGRQKSQLPIKNIFKTHELDIVSHMLMGHPNIKVFIPRRDLRDAVASWMRRIYNKHNGEPFVNPWFAASIDDCAYRNKMIKGYIQNWLRLYDSWKDKGDYEFIYETWKQENIEEKLSIIHNIAMVMETCLDLKDCHDIYHHVEIIMPSIGMSIDTPPSQHAGDQLLTRNHMTNNGAVGGYKNILSDAEICLVEDMAGDWLREKGYMT
tara:strand:- start:465 stop:1244 length:780 start_codon:yes stop_codon:yes gene_type:complete